MLAVIQEVTMKIRNLLIGFVLAMMVLGAGSFTPTTAQNSFCSRSCTNNIYRPCMEECAPNDVACQDVCQDNYDCCFYMCTIGDGECPLLENVVQ